MISAKFSRKSPRNSTFKILISLFASFKFVSCSKKLNDVSDDSDLREPLSKKLTVYPAGTVFPSG